MKIDDEELRQRRRANRASTAQSLLAYWAYSETGLSGKEIARYLKLSRSAVSQRVEKGRVLAKSDSYLIS